MYADAVLESSLSAKGAAMTGPSLSVFRQTLSSLYCYHSLRHPFPCYSCPRALFLKESKSATPLLSGRRKEDIEIALQQDVEIIRRL